MHFRQRTAPARGDKRDVVGSFAVNDFRQLRSESLVDTAFNECGDRLRHRRDAKRVGLRFVGDDLPPERLGLVVNLARRLRKPLVERAVEKTEVEDDQTHHRDDRQHQRAHDQLGLDAGTEAILPRVDVQLEQTAENNEPQRKHADDDESRRTPQNDGLGGPSRSKIAEIERRLPERHDGQQDQQDAGNNEGDPLTLSFHGPVRDCRATPASQLEMMIARGPRKSGGSQESQEHSLACISHHVARRSA